MLRWLLRVILMGSGVLLIVIALGFGPLFLQDQPMLDATPPPSAQDVAATRRLVHDIRAAADAPDDAGGLLRTDVVQLNSAIRLGARFIDGFRGRITVEGDEVLGAFSVPVSWWSGRKWLNVSGRVPEFDGRFVLSEVTIGSTRVPPALALSLARVGANLGLGNRIGDTALQAATAMAITGAGEGAALSFRIALNDVGKNGVMRGAFGALRGAQMPTQDEVETYHLLIRAAMEKGRLPQTGSFLPYLHFTLDAVLNRTTSDALPHAYTAAVLGLAKACGAADFSAIVGRLVFDTQEIPETWASSCDAVTFNGRIDSRRHFITSAALQAASNTGFSVSVGEFKELYDTISGAGGFDFTDLAANLSGIRMSNVLMARPAEAWPALIARLQEENDVIVTFDGIPQIMSEASFKARFGDVDSVAYREMLTRIEARISQLGLYQAE